MESKVIEQGGYGHFNVNSFIDGVVYVEQPSVDAGIMIEFATIPDLIAALASFCTPEQLETIINELKKDKV